MNLVNGKKVLVIGAGLAGCEAAFYFARHNIKVFLVECKSFNPNPAQKMTTYAELVCTNSLKSTDANSAHGLLKREMKALGSAIIKIAEQTFVPAGDALAVDRKAFSTKITEEIKAHPLIDIIELDATNPLEMAEKFGCSYTIIASGPLTTSGLENWIKDNISNDDFYFYDAIAPIVDADSIDHSKLYFKDRYKKIDNRDGIADYLNAPMNQEQYEKFISELKKAKKVSARNFEDYKFFESCLPIDLMAERGVDTPRFSCMKPVGLEMKDGKRPYAVVQLRRENLLGKAYNLVGFQNRLIHSEQKRIFRMIPGLEQATFITLGSVHRNSFLNAKKLLNFDLSSKKFPNIFFAGQITGVEGYTESASMGLYVAFQINRKLNGLPTVSWPIETGIGALINYLMTAANPIPSNINFGLLPTLEMTHVRKKQKKKELKKLKKKMISDRALRVLQQFAKNFIF